MSPKTLLALSSLLLSTTGVLAESPQKSAPWQGATLDGISCASIAGTPKGYGPFDYIKPHTDYDLNVVEQHHFTPEVENLIKGNTGSLETDLSYTLRAWPNHHRALLSITRYQLKIKMGLSPDKLLIAPPECYFQRAIHFSPEDAAVYALYGYYLKEMGHPQEADKVYQQALRLEPENAKFAYSYSYLLIDLKQYDKAAEYAKRAYQHGKPPPGLKKKLQQLGAWRD